MESQIKRLYEGMFVLPQSFVREDQQAAFDMLQDLFKKFDVEVKHLNIWAERSLAYEINHVREATYILTYIECTPEKVAKVERAVHISDNILRCLIVKPEPRFNLEEYAESLIVVEEGIDEEPVAAAVPAVEVAATAAIPAVEVAAPALEKLDSEEVK